MSGILVIGAGGHAKVLADILLLRGDPILGYLDDNPQLWGQTRLGLPVLGGIDTWQTYSPDGLLLGIGINGSRRNTLRRFDQTADSLWVTAIHPSAVIAPSVHIGAGSVIIAGAIINADTTIGEHSIVNTGATVGHDCVVGSFVHIAPGVNLTGGTWVGEGAFVGAGTVAIPGRQIGEWSTVGAGSVVIKDIPPHVIAKGAPARWE